jgi:SAM-dependent methyltransferase
VVTRPEVTYDRIGVGYSGRRRPDPRLARRIDAALGRARLVLNVGAGAGSYEPVGRRVIAVEPSATMVAQRGETGAVALRGVVERLPVADDAVDATLAVLTMHHWSDMVAGLREMGRVSVDRQVVMTWNQRVAEDRFWFIRDYAPELMAAERATCPPFEVLRRVLGRVTVVALPIPADCTDGFFAAFWRRPAAYLDDGVRAAISVFALNEPWRYEDGLARLEADLTSGLWHERYAPLLDLDELDLGYRLVIGHAGRG